MPRAVSCVLDGVQVGVDEAIKLRDAAEEAHQPSPAFRCERCGAPVKPHSEGGAAAAHFEHFDRNADCPLSDPPR